MATEVNRRDFLNALGVTVGAAALSAAGSVATPALAAAQEAPKGKLTSPSSSAI